MGGGGSKGKGEINNPKKAENEKDEKLKDKKSKDDKDDKEKAPALPPVPYFQLFRYATSKDKILLALGSLVAAGGGACLPVMINVFGDITQTMIEGNVTIPEFCSSVTTTTSPFLANSNFTRNDEVDPYENFMNELGRLTIIMGIIGLANLIMFYFFVTTFNSVSENLVYRLRKLYLESLLRQNVGWYDTNQDKNFVSRITEDLTKVGEATGEKVVLAIFFMSVSLCSLANAFYHGWKLTLVILSSAPVLAIATGIVAGFQSKLASTEQQSYAKAGNVAEEAITNVRTVMAFSGAAKEIERYEVGLADAKKAGRKRGAISAFGVGLMWLIIYADYALAFWYGTKLILDGRHVECEGKEPEYNAAKLLIIFFSVLMGAFNVGQSASYFEAFAVGRGAAAVIYNVIDRVPEIDSYSEAGKKPSARATGQITFSGIHFFYPSRPEVQILKNFSLQIKPGQTIALVGHSGCGKSTCLQLLQRFYDPLSGMVSVDGHDIRELHLGWLRSQIGVVSQEPVLFNTTILENIRYGRDGVTQQEIEEACRQSNAHAFISKLPKKYNTIVGDRGAQLSGGQKQRIAIARALVRNPAILLLDEATSALDTQSESIVQNALDRARQGRTTLIVAHRLSTIKAADSVIAIDEGQVVEQGTHNELLKKKGLYYQLVLAQMQGRNEEVELDEKESESKVAHHEMGFRADVNTPVDDIDDVAVVAVVDEDSLDEKELAKTSPFVRLLGYSRPEYPHIFIGTIMSIIQGAMLPIYAIIFGEFMEVLQEARTKSEDLQDEVNQYAMYFLFIGLGAGISMFFQLFMFALSGEALTMRLRKLTFTAVLNQEPGWFDNPSNSVGALSARLSGDGASVQGATGSRIGSVIQAVSTIGIAIGLSFYFVPKLGAVALAFVPIVIVATYFQGKLMTGQNVGEKKGVEDSSKVAVQSVANIRTVASLCKERAFVEMYQQGMRKPHRHILKIAHLRGFIFGLAQAVPFFAYGVVMYYGGTLMKNEGVEMKRVFQVGESLIFGTMMVGQTMAFAPNYNKAILSGARILRLLDRISAIVNSPGVGLRMNDSLGSVQFDKVAFSYPTRPTAKILRSLSLAVEPGKSIALVGPSGCGKSTCIQLILRFYDPHSGKVMLDTVDVASLNVDNLRSQMAIVAQEPALFDRTLAENIAYGDNSRNVTMDEIINAAKMANIHSFISTLPAGYETRVGEMGTQLSGGQKQRVAIARALIRNPKILLLDEATSALDTESEQIVQAALETASSGRTSITIAHRLSSIQNVDKILVMSNGELIEEGTHSELLNRGGLYHRLWNMQGVNKSRTD